MNSLSVLENRQSTLNIWDSSDSLKQIKEIYGKNLSHGEFNTLVQMGMATSLNPFLKEIWAVKYGDNQAQIFIGRDGYRKSAQRHPLYDYHVADAVYSNDTFDVINGEINHKYNLQNRGQLIGAYCIVQRKNSSRPTYVFVELKEYSTNKSLWNSQTGKPSTMIKKVAEAQGLRSAFQELFSGTYSEYEDFTKPTTPYVNSPAKGVSGLKERLGIVNKVESFETVEVDTDTGEVIEVKAEESENKSEVFDTIMFLMDSASSKKDLLSAMKLAKDLSLEERKIVSEVFNKKQSEFNS